MSYSVLERPFPVLERPFLLCPVLSRVPSRFLAVPARPVPWQDFELVPLSQDNEGTSIPLSQEVALSCLVGNTSFNQGVLQRSLVQLICQNMAGGWVHFSLGPRCSDRPDRYKQCVCCSPVGLFVQFAWNLEMCGGYLAAVVLGTYGMVWQNTVRSKEDLNPKGVVLLGFCSSSIAH